MKLNTLSRKIFAGVVAVVFVTHAVLFYTVTKQEQYFAKEPFDDLWAINFSVFGTSALVILIFSYLWIRRWTGPVSQLASEIKHIKRGQYYRRVSDDDFVSKEISQIRRSANKMASKLELLDRELDTTSSDMANVMSSLGEGLVAIDSNFKVRFANPMALKILGFESAKAKPEYLNECFKNQDSTEFVRKAIEKKLANEMEVKFVGDDNRSQTYQLRTQPYSIDRSHHGVIVLLLDITELKNLENYRKDFVSNVSHELRTPLTAIRGFSETLTEVPAEKTEDIRKFSNIIHDHAVRLSALVEDLLTLSKMESQSQAQMKDQFHMTRMSTLIPHAVAVCEKKARKKSIQIESIIKADIEKPVITHLFEQALINLIDNAINYSPENAKVQVVLDCIDSTARFHIIDNGPGIDSKHLPRLFERFYRVDEGRDRMKGGSGVGLALVKHIAQVHGGKVSVSSVLGNGSHFILELP